MKQSSKRLSSIIIAILLLVVAAVVFFEMVQPAYATMEALKGQVVGEQALLATDQALVSSIKSLVSTYQGQNNAQQLVSLALPVGQNNAQAFAQIYGVAANSGFSLQSVGVSVQAAVPPSGAAAATSTASGTKAVSAIVKQTGSISYQITAVASYESFKTFLQGLETNTRLFNISTITIRPLQSAIAGQGPGTQDLFNFSITAIAYYQTP